MSSIVTFYSYKGGVGRSMALANIAVLLARRGLKVLAVDWDLEAPGLERYFSYFEIKQGGPGLLRMCMAARATGGADYTAFTSSFECQGKYPVTLLASGREADDTYTQNLETFDWEEFFRGGGGAFVETLRERWRKDFDVTLIDSRTGLSDTGGICTIQLPDIVIGMFTANLQSLYGVRDVMRLAQQARQSLAYDRMPLSVFPLATRWGVQEFQETQIWLDRVAEATTEFFADWLPKRIAPRDVIEATKIPQIAYFGFGERLAVIEHGTSDPQGMGFVYDKVASFIEGDFINVDALVGKQKVPDVAVTTPALPSTQTQTAAAEDYLYDVFFSYHKSMSDLVFEIADRLKAHLASLRGETPKTFIDAEEIRSGDLWRETLSEALLRSKVLVALITPQYATSQYASKEFGVFRDRAEMTGTRVVIPVLLRGESFPDFINDIAWIDLRSLPQTRRSTELDVHVQRIATAVSASIDGAPPFDSSWRGRFGTIYAPVKREITVEERLVKALRESRYKWRTIERVAIEAGVGTNVALRLLRAMPNVTFSKGKSGKRIVGLTQGVRKHSGRPIT